MIKAYNKVPSNFYGTNHLTIATHNIKYYYLDSNLLGNRLFSDFKSIDNITLRKTENRYVVVVQGSVYLYGIKNEHGFHDIDNDNFITTENLDDTKRIINELRNQDALHYVKRRIR